MTRYLSYLNTAVIFLAAVLFVSCNKKDESDMVRLVSRIDRYHNIDGNVTIDTSEEFRYDEQNRITKVIYTNSYVNGGVVTYKYPSANTSLAKIIISKYPDVDYRWLVTGKGEMLKNETSHDHIDKDAAYRLVPIINYDFVGGMHGDSDAATTDAEYIMGTIPFNDALETDICVPVTGDSMAPTCPSGSFVLLREVAGWKDYFGYGNIFCILLNDGRRLLKEINKSNENHRENVLCVSHNNAVLPEELPKEMINRVWKVIKILTNKGW